MCPCRAWASVFLGLQGKYNEHTGLRRVPRSSACCEAPQPIPLSLPTASLSSVLPACRQTCSCSAAPQLWRERPVWACARQGGAVGWPGGGRMPSPSSAQRLSLGASEDCPCSHRCCSLLKSGPASFDRVLRRLLPPVAYGAGLHSSLVDPKPTGHWKWASNTQIPGPHPQRF